MRLIDADALMQTLGITDMDCEKCVLGSHGFCMRGGGFTDACEAIENAPTIEPERKTGRWIKVGHIENTYLVSKCYVCGYQTIDAGNYCTNCGAKMEVEHDGNC